MQEAWSLTAVLGQTPWSIKLLTKVDTPASEYHEGAHALSPDLLNSSFWLSAASQPLASLTISEADSAHLSIQRSFLQGWHAQLQAGT